MSLTRRLLLPALAALIFTGCQTPDVHQYQPILQDRINEVDTAAQPQEATPPDRLQPQVDRTTWPGQAIDLDNAIAIAFDNSPKLKSIKKDVYISDEQIRVARSAFLPQLSGRSGYAFNKEDTAWNDQLSIWQSELDLQWMIWDFGRSLGRYHQAEFAKDISSLTYDRFCQSLIFQVAQSYYDVLRAEKAKKIAQDALTSATLHLETAKSLNSQDLVTIDNVLRAEVQVAEYQQSLIRANNAIKVALSGLNRTMGINVNWPTAVVEPDDRPLFDHPLTWALGQAIGNRSEFEQIQLGIALERSGLDVAQAEYLPEFFVSSTYTHNDDGNRLRNDSVTSMLGIQIQLYSGGRRGAQVRQAEHRLSQSLDQAKEVCDTIAFEVKQAYLGIEDAGARLAVSEKAVSSAGENRRLVSEKYKHNLATSTDVADAEATYTQAQQNYYTALYDLMFAVERLHFAMGTNEVLHRDVNTQF